MDTLQAIEQRRTIRLFKNIPVEQEKIDALVRILGLYPSGANLQPLKFRIVQKKEECDAVFPCLKLAGYLPDFVIEKDQQPTAYVVVVQDTTVAGNAEYAAGAATNALCIAATAMGLGTCIIGSCDREKLYEILTINPERYHILYAVALGYPDHEADYVPMTDSIQYYRTADGAFHVPKRQDILL